MLLAGRIAEDEGDESSRIRGKLFSREKYLASLCLRRNLEDAERVHVDVLHTSIVREREELAALRFQEPVGNTVRVRVPPFAPPTFVIRSLRAVLPVFSALVALVPCSGAQEQQIARLLPSTYTFEGMRAALSTGSVQASLLASALALNVVYLAAGAAFFGWMLARVREKGYLSRLGME